MQIKQLPRDLQEVLAFRRAYDKERRLRRMLGMASG